jgi:hypothetical protein
LNVHGVQGVEDVAGIENGAVASRNQGELRYLGVDELTEPRQKMEALGGESSRGHAIRQALFELAVIGLEVTRELQ